MDTKFAVYQSLMDIDFFAPLRLTQLLLPEMIKRRSGQIAVVSSAAGKFGAPLRTGYHAAKHACIGYFDALRSEIEVAYDIAVSVIVPGFVKTGISVNASTASGDAFGKEDPNIEAGMSAKAAAAIIADGLGNREPEIVVADGRIKGAMHLRGSDPKTLFALMAQEGDRLGKLRLQSGLSFAVENAMIDVKRA